VEFLSDQEAAAFGRYGSSVPRADLERFFYLDDGDRKLLAGLRGDHSRLGFSVQLTTVRYIGRFLADPLEGVPTEVIDFLAGQLGIADPSCVKRYAQREPTHREHAGKIQKALGLKDFARTAPLSGIGRCRGCQHAIVSGGDQHPQPLATRFPDDAEQGREQCPIRLVQLRVVRLMAVQDGDLVAQEQNPGGPPRLLAAGQPQPRDHLRDQEEDKPQAHDR